MAFEQEHEREPSTEELAELLEMSETEINNIFQSNTRHTSLDAPVHEAEDVAMGESLRIHGSTVRLDSAYIQIGSHTSSNWVVRNVEPA